MLAEGDAVVAEYRARLATRGRRVRVEPVRGDALLGTAVDVTDDGALDAQTVNSVGADIDAVGAISTRLVTGVPEASTWAMLIVGFGAVGGTMRRRTRRSAAIA